jgi:hypothetical protein
MSSIGLYEVAVAAYELLEYVGLEATEEELVSGFESHQTAVRNAYEAERTSAHSGVYRPHLNNVRGTFKDYYEGGKVAVGSLATGIGGMFVGSHSPDSDSAHKLDESNFVQGVSYVPSFKPQEYSNLNKMKSRNIGNRLKRLEQRAMPETKYLDFEPGFASVATGGQQSINIMTVPSRGTTDSTFTGNRIKVTKIEITGLPYGLSAEQAGADCQLILIPTGSDNAVQTLNAIATIGTVIPPTHGRVLKHSMLSREKNTVKWVHKFKYPLTVMYTDQTTCVKNALYIQVRNATLASITPKFHCRIFFIDA